MLEWFFSDNASFSKTTPSFYTRLLTQLVTIELLREQAPGYTSGAVETHLYPYLHYLAVAIPGIQVSDVQLDLPAMLKAKDTSVKQLTGGIAQLFKKNKVGFSAVIR